jgi:hypothetical protein
VNVLRACLDWRVLTGLAALAVVVYVVAPGLIAAAVPLLLLAACPLSMLVMMRAMGGQRPEPSSAPSQPIAADRAAVLRRELADLGRRQEQMAGELRAIEQGPRDAAARTSDASAPTSAHR